MIRQKEKGKCEEEEREKTGQCLFVKLFFRQVSQPEFPITLCSMWSEHRNTLYFSYYNVLILDLLTKYLYTQRVFKWLVAPFRLWGKLL